MTKFQEELKAAIDLYSDWKASVLYYHEVDYHDIAWMEREKDKAWQKLESFIARCVDRQEALCGVCQYNLDNHPPGPGEPNIFTYKKALELACRSHLDTIEQRLCRCETHCKEEITSPDYWIELVGVQE